MDPLPNGIVTFAFTDVEGSTKLWEESPDAMLTALGVLDDFVEETVERNGGVVVKPRGEGDSHFLVFTDAMGAVTAVSQLQMELASASWPTSRPLKVRAAIHTGSADLIAGDYYGPAVNRTARLRAIAHGGQTIISRATWEQVADVIPDGVTIEDMGEHGLKDLTRPEQVFQVLVDGLDADFPPLASLHEIPNNLPEQLTDFIGRREELASAVALLSDTRLLTILAPGGSGKTRLAIQVAADLAGEFSDGVFFIGLSEIESSSEIIQVVAEALGLGLAADEDLEVQLLNYLSNKDQLLIFDNFEHLADGVGIVSAILKRASGVKVIATSRAKLNLSGETVLAIAGLETSWDTPEEAVQRSGVRLFLEAAARSNPGFELSEGDLESLARILKMTEGLPLAILLAASWVDMLGVAEIADEIGKSLDFLETEMGDVPDRHRSVRAVFDYSWALLDENQRAAFSKLSVFRGGFTREAAEAVAGANLRSLSSLTGKSLITANIESGRYTVHELLRQFAEAEFAKDAAQFNDILDEHARFYAGVVEEATMLLTSADQPRMAGILERDLDNMRFAWRHALRISDAESGLKILRGLFFLYEWRGWFRSGVGFFDEAVASLDKASSDPKVIQLRAMAALVRSWYQILIGQAVVAAPAAVEAISALPASADSVDHWLARQCVAIAHGYSGGLNEMIQITDEGIELAATMGDEFFVAGMMNWRSFAAVVNQDPETAKDLLAQAIVVFEDRDDLYFRTWALWLLALVALAEGRTVDAIGLFSRQVAVTEPLAYLRGRVVAFEGLGDANHAADRLQDARTAYVRSLSAADQMGMVADMLGLMTKIGKVLASEGRHPEAVELFSTVCAEPLSDRMTFSYTSPIRDTATQALDELQTQLDASTFADAKQTGESRDWETAAKELMDSLDQG
ncbi:MAG: adenylate/guanylate cyclase domain-containing protein [Acidimicrobiia bacterium]